MFGIEAGGLSGTRRVCSGAFGALLGPRRTLLLPLCERARAGGV